MSQTVVDLIESGASMIAGTCDDALRPECMRGLGACVSEDRMRLTVILNAELCERMARNVEANGRMAVAFSRIHDHHTIQLKGRVVRQREATHDDALIVERYVGAFSEQATLAGLPRSVIQTMRRTRCVAFELSIDEIFDQTPGPNAGGRYTS